MTFATTPNFLTLVRMAFVPVVVIALSQQSPNGDVVATLAFVVASITDYFDGKLAREQKQITIYGKLLDPMADKFLVVSSLIMLHDLGRIPAVAVILLICRELAITGLRALASAEGIIIDASGGGKWKTAAQMVAIPLLMILAALPDSPDWWYLFFYWSGTILLWTSLTLSLWSAKDYIVDFFKALRIKKRSSQAHGAIRKRFKKPFGRKKSPPEQAEENK